MNEEGQMSLLHAAFGYPFRMLPVRPRDKSVDGKPMMQQCRAYSKSWARKQWIHTITLLAIALAQDVMVCSASRARRR